MSTHLSILCGNDQFQLCIHPCSEDIKRQWQQCWYRLPIQIVYPEDAVSHVQTARNQYVGRDFESWDHVPTLPSPKLPPDFAHHDGDKVLHCRGAKWPHAQALQVYGEQPASPYSARVHSIILATDRRTIWQRMVKHNSTSAEERDVRGLQSILNASCYFLPRWRSGTPSFLLLSYRSNECIQDWSTVNMRSFLQSCRTRAVLSLWSLVSVLRSAQTFLFPMLLVRLR